MIHECLSNGCTFDDDTGTFFVVCPVCGHTMDGPLIAEAIPELTTDDDAI